MGEALKARLLERIRAGGPITFERFMEEALYDPEEGFYARPPIGADGHFVTSPHVSPAFGALVGRQVAQCWDLLEEPDGFTVVEVGAGDGTFARQVREALASVPELAPTRYVAVERSPGCRDALGALGLEVHASLGEVEPVTGCVVANEVLDNVPFHRLRERDGRTVEVMVGADGDRLIEVEAEPTLEAMAALRRTLRPGNELPVSPQAVDLVRRLAGTLARGYALLFDYGFGPEEQPGPVHGYRDNRVLADVLEDPGSSDVTAAVDLEAVAETAREAGLTVWGPVTQREALLALGFRIWTQGVRSRQERAERNGDWREATRLYSERSRATILIDPPKLGGLKLMVLGTEGLPPPAAVLGDRQAGC